MKTELYGVEGCAIQTDDNFALPPLDNAFGAYFSVPPVYTWRCYLYGTDNLIFEREEGKQPNWFWRKMQHLILGNRWERIQ